LNDEPPYDIVSELTETMQSKEIKHNFKPQTESSPQILQVDP